MIRIGVMGAAGSFSEQAGQMYVVDEVLESVQILPCVTAEGVFEALHNMAIDKAIFPIMNNNGGIVIESMQAIGKYTFVIETMFEMDVHHMLLALPGTLLADITTIASHDQALKQCRGYLDRLWGQADIMPYRDTAAAAADLAAGVLGTNTAVVASRRAAELYGLHILESSIQDAVINKTTFMVASRKL